jgi:hypothetical protein
LSYQRPAAYGFGLELPRSSLRRDDACRQATQPGRVVGARRWRGRRRRNALRSCDPEGSGRRYGGDRSLPSDKA